MLGGQLDVDDNDDDDDDDDDDNDDDDDDNDDDDSCWSWRGWQSVKDFTSKLDLEEEIINITIFIFMVFMISILQSLPQSPILGK